MSCIEKVLKKNLNAASIFFIKINLAIVLVQYIPHRNITEILTELRFFVHFDNFLKNLFGMSNVQHSHKMK